MQIRFFCPRWGAEQLPLDKFLRQVKKAGYDGVEMPLPPEAEEQKILKEGLATHGLLWIGQHYETLRTDFDQHLIEIEQRFRTLALAGPLFINSQTGKDYFSYEQNAALIGAGLRVEKETGVTILHETHRGKFSFAAHVTRQFLEGLPDLKITLDISHWFAVAETFLQDQQEALDLAISRAEHIHSRVGFTEGPQIGDPRAPEWKDVLQTHLDCWDRIVDRHRSAGRHFFTITPEFGPAPYMPLQPYILRPLADQWDVNIYMMHLLKERYATS